MTGTNVAPRNLFEIEHIQGIGWARDDLRKQAIFGQKHFDEEGRDSAK